MKLPKSSYNWVSLSGAIVALFSLFMIVFLFIVSTLLGEGSSYLGLFIFIVLPAFLVLGLLIIPLGMILKIRRDKQRGSIVEPGRWPEINLNTSRHRNAALIFGAGSVVFLLFTALGSYEAYHYTESVEFCGEVCHTVMEPEFVAYQNSSHARVATRIFINSFTRKGKILYKAEFDCPSLNTLGVWHISLCCPDKGPRQPGCSSSRPAPSA